LRIMHTCLNVVDLDRSITFYQDRLGLKLEFPKSLSQLVTGLNGGGNSAMDVKVNTQ